jgi:hypothetical protein
MFSHQTSPDGPMNDGTDMARRLLRGGLSATDDPIDAYHSLLLLLESTGEEAVLWASTTFNGPTRPRRNGCSSSPGG